MFLNRREILVIVILFALVLAFLQFLFLELLFTLDVNYVGIILDEMVLFVKFIHMNCSQRVTPHISIVGLSWLLVFFLFLSLFVELALFSLFLLHLLLLLEADNEFTSHLQLSMGDELEHLPYLVRDF